MAIVGPGGSSSVGIANIANRKCCCNGGCLCPDGFRSPTDYVTMVLSGFTGVFAVFNGTWTLTATAPGQYDYDVLVSGNRYRFYWNCSSGSSSTWRSAYGLFYGYNETSSPSYDWTIGTFPGDFQSWTGTDSCSPLYFSRTLTTTMFYDVFVPSYVPSDVSQTFTMTVSR